MRARGFDLKEVGWLAALPLLAIAAGSLGGGAVSDALARRFGARAGLRAARARGPSARRARDPRRDPDATSRASLRFCLAAAAGLAALGVAPAWSVCLAVGGRHAGVVSGAMNTFGNLGGVASPLVMGWSLDAIGSWNVPLYSVVAFYAIAALCWLAIDPSAHIDDRRPPRTARPPSGTMAAPA